MRKRDIFSITGLMGSFVTLAVLTLTCANKTNDAYEAKGYTAQSSLPTTIDLKDNSATEIKSYYSSLTGKSSSELQGTNLLKNLKTILKNGQKYYAYDTTSDKTNIWRMYEIIDRDWDLSPASSISGYSSNTNKITGYSYGSSNSNPGSNPYVHSLYTNRSVTNEAKAWGAHTQTEWGINQEHVWPKSQGFETEGAGGARGDILHLWAGNGYANNIHSNHPYGYVDTSKTYTNCGTKYSYLDGNLKGYSKTLSSSSATVYEPQDSDKGDIARAIFYMAARYNYFSGSDSDGIDANNPNLVLVQDAPEKTSYTASTTVQGEMGILSDLLEWNKIDPPDAWEIHRNNLCYNNYTGNRNPFIDYPEWANFIWGTASNNTYTSSTPTGYVDLSKDVINGWRSTSDTTVSLELDQTSASVAVGGTLQLTATCSSSGASISWSSGSTSIATVSSSGLVTGKAAGSTTITASTTVNSKKYTATCTVSVTNTVVNVTSVSISPSTLELDLNGTKTSTVTAVFNPTNATNKAVTWSSENDSIATVSQTGLVTAVAIGTTNIKVTTTDGNKVGTCAVTVKDTSTSDQGQMAIVFNSTSDGKDSSSKYSTTTFIDNAVLSGSEYISSVDTCDYVYPGKTGLKYGTTSYAGDLKLTLSSSVTAKQLSSVSISCAQYGSDTGTLQVYLNNNSTAALTVTPSDASGTYTFSSATVLSSIEIKTSAKRAYLTGITFGYKVDSTVVNVTGITLDKTTASMDVNGSATLTLTPTITPSNATNKTVIWTSSKTSVATVANGVVTALEAGTTTITAKTDDGGYTATCVITVSDSTDRSEESTVNIEKGDYTAGYTATTGTSGTISKTVASDNDLSISYSGINTQSAAGSSYSYTMYLKDYGYIYNTSAPKYYYPSKVLVTFSSGTGVAGKIGATFATSAITSLDTSVTGSVTKSGTYEATNSDQSLLYWNISTISGNVQISSIAITYSLKSNTYTIANFISYFDTAFTCDATGQTAPKFNNGYSWTTIATKFSSLSTTDKNTLINLTYTEAEITSGTDAQKLVAKYDYIIAKYGESQYANFMGRSITSSINNGFLDSDNSKTNFPILVPIGLIAFTGVLYVIYRKKKEN